MPPLLDDEHGSDDALVLAQEQAPRREPVALVQHRQHAVLAAHIVRPRWDRPQGRPAQHEFPYPHPPLARLRGRVREVAEAQQISQIGLAAAELPHEKRPLRARQMRPQIRFEPARIEPFVEPLIDQLGGFEGS